MAFPFQRGTGNSTFQKYMMGEGGLTKSNFYGCGDGGGGGTKGKV